MWLRILGRAAAKLNLAAFLQNTGPVGVTPKPQTRGAKPDARNPKLETWGRGKPETRNPKPKACTLHPKPWTLKFELYTLIQKSRALDHDS